MSVTSRSPTRVAGAVLNSGNVNTGEQNFTLGGGRTVCVYSGDGGAFRGVADGNQVNAGPDTLFFSGGGRLKDVLITGGGASGVYPQVTFYDAGVATSGGPFVASGVKFLGFLPASSGNALPMVFAFDVPFQSGLCANIKSGAAPFTFTYTPEAQPALANPG